MRTDQKTNLSGIRSSRMEWSAIVLTGLTLVLSTANGQNTSDSQTTRLPSTDTSNVGATTIIPTVPTQTTATLSPTQTVTSMAPESPNTANISIINSSLVRGCSQNPPLCCLNQNNSCNRGVGCFCDVFCLRNKDCCPDFISTCITGFQNASSLPSASNTTNTTAVPESPSPFPVLSFPGFGRCSADPVLCCDNASFSCFRGCFCDQSCVANNDCCSDYNHTCSDVKIVISNWGLSVLAPPTSDDFSVQELIRQNFLKLEAELKNIIRPVRSVRILKITKT